MKTITTPTDLCLQAESRETAALGLLPALRENGKISKLFQIVAASWLLAGAGSVTAASVDPVVVDPWQSGDAAFECGQAEVSCDFAYKIDNWKQQDGMDGTYEEAGNTITISNSNGKTFDWASEFPVCAVIVKAGTGANIYYYAGAYADSGLVSPDSKDISHVTFCFDAPEVMPLTVTKTAVTSYTRTHFWDIAKIVSTENGYTLDGFPKIWLYTDGSGDESATWTVDVSYEDYEDSDYNVSGEITVTNNSTMDVVISSIVDVLEDGTSFTIDCGVGFPYALAGGETLICTYSEDGYVEGINLATVTTGQGEEYSATADIIWGDPTTEVNATVNIKDTSDLDGETDLGTATAPGDAQFSYSTDFAWADYGADGCGSYQYNNTATIVETEQSADASLKVNVQCYIYETAYALGDPATCFIEFGFANWGWTNLIGKGSYSWPLWAAAAQCDTLKGTLVGLVSVDYNDNGVSVQYDVASPFILDETHVYADTDLFPKSGRRNMPTVAPGAYYIGAGLRGGIHVIAHAVVGIPDPDFGPEVP